MTAALRGWLLWQPLKFWGRIQAVAIRRNQAAYDRWVQHPDGYRREVNQ